MNFNYIFHGQTYIVIHFRICFKAIILWGKIRSWPSRAGGANWLAHFVYRQQHLGDQIPTIEILRTSRMAIHLDSVPARRCLNRLDCFHPDVDGDPPNRTSTYHFRTPRLWEPRPAQQPFLCPPKLLHLRLHSRLEAAWSRWLLRWLTRLQGEGDCEEVAQQMRRVKLGDRWCACETEGSPIKTSRPSIGQLGASGTCWYTHLG